MKEMTTEDIKSVSLDVLQEFHDFCISNNLRYSLGFGTLIGAIRHKGFIPWDDDIDVTMPRSDYERFFELYKNNSRFSAFDHNHGNAFIAFGRICDMDKTYVDTSSAPWIRNKTGVWIDIFPLDGSEDNLDNLRKRMAPIKKKWHRGIIIRSTLKNMKDCPTFLHKIKWVIKKAIFIGQDLNRIIDEHISECKKYEWDYSKYVGHFSHLEYRIKALWLKEDFETVEQHEFEGRKFCVCSGYDRVLRMIYGDYMKLPPKEKQIPRHSFNKYYWK